jgi:hypothetical protein
MNSDVTWLDMIDRLETGTQASNTMVLAGLLVRASGGKVHTIRTYEKGVLTDTINVSDDVIG